jgi:uncharacterized protein (DUF885 family)
MTIDRPGDARAATDPDTGLAEAQLADLAERFWDGYLEAYPIFATIIGDRRFDDRLPDRSADGRQSQLAWYLEIERAARAIDPEALSPGRRVTRQMLVDEAAGQAASIRTGIDEWTVDPLGGPTVSLLDLVDWHTVDEPARGRGLVERWRAVGRYVDEIIESARRAAANGRVACVTPVERVLDVLGHLDRLAPEEWRMASPARAPLEGWPEDERERFRADVLDAVRDVAMPAFRRYGAVLRDEILPVARPPERPGLAHVPGGDAAYRTLIRVHTTLELDPEEIHRTGLAEIERIDAELVELGGRVLGTRDLASTLAALRDDAALRFSTADEVFETAKRSLQRATAAVTDWFGRVPGAACVVVPIPDHSAEHQTIAYYYWPAMDGSRPGRYYINLHAPETRPRYEAEALAFHEAVPGHHLQIAIAQELDDVPAFQRNLGSTAFAEGWGLYTERLSDEMGLYSGDMDRFGILSFDAWRAGRLVVDTGMHALGWSRQQAIDFLAGHSALGLNNIANEVDRYIVWPGQALAYKIGQLEIVRLRREAERRLGARFDIKAFHDTVLGSGAVSLPALAGIVERWLDTSESMPFG